MSKWKNGVFIGLILLLVAGVLYGSGTYRFDVPKGLSIGDILYANRTDRMTNLNSGALGTVVESAGLLTAPAYVAKNTYREATIHNFATLAASWTVSSDEALCYFLASTNANGSATIRLPSTTGKVFLLRNGSGQNNVVLPGGGGSGITLATARAVQLLYDSNISEYVKCGTEVVSPHTP